MKNLLIYSTLDSAYLAKLIAQSLGLTTSEIIRSKFSDGELYHRFKIDNNIELLGKNVILVGSTNTDQNFDELEKIGHTLAECGTSRRIFIIPFFGYSTMERAVLPGESVTTKINARRLSAIPSTNRGNVFLMLDLHNSGILHYFEGDCLRYELYGEKVLGQAIEELKLDKFVFGTADLGRTKWVDNFANKFKTDIVFVRKSRVKSKTKVLNVIGDVAGKTIVIYDDMIRSGDTLLKAVDAYLKRGAIEVYAVLSHLAFNDASVIKKMLKSPITKIITTNSHPMSQHSLVKRSKRIIVKDISQEFVDIIKKIND